MCPVSDEASPVQQRWEEVSVTGLFRRRHTPVIWELLAFRVGALFLEDERTSKPSEDVSMQLSFTPAKGRRNYYATMTFPILTSVSPLESFYSHETLASIYWRLGCKNVEVTYKQAYEV